MIPSIKPMKVKKYLHIDRLAEGLGFCEPQEGEEFLGIPVSWYGDESDPFIQVSKNGKIIRTVNCSDLAIIEFLEG